jgi:hypothetical protein
MHCCRAYFFFFLGIQISLEKKKEAKVQFHLEKKNQEIMAALQYKPQPQWKMGKKNTSRGL